MTKIKINLFGKFQLQYNQSVLERLPSHKTQELFYYLLIYRYVPHNRENLASIFWGERSTSESRKYLRKNIWQLKSTLTEFIDPLHIEFIDVDTEWIQIIPHPQIWLDLDEFEKIFTDSKGVRGRNLQNDQYTSLQHAVYLYRGALLEGCHQEWCIYEREKYQDMQITMLDKLMGYCEANEKYSQGIEYGKKILANDRARERTHVRMMRLYQRSGDRTKALRQFDCCKLALMEELNVEPSISTISLYYKIIKDNFRDRNHNKYSVKNDDRKTYIQVNESLKRIRDLISLEESIHEEILKEINILEHQ